MKKELINEFAIRIANANRLQLLQINYEMLIQELTELKDKEKLEFKSGIEQSSKILTELIISLDMSYEISIELKKIYLYMNSIIMQNKIKKDVIKIEEVIKLCKILLDAWEKCEIKEEAVMENSQKIYAGMTYNKDNITEIIDYDSNRGYKV